MVQNVTVSSRASETLPYRTEKTITFTGGTTDSIGDHDGASDPFTIFVLTGLVRAKLYAICTTSMAGASSTIEVGLTGDTATLIALTTATNLIINEIWHDATPDSFEELSSVTTERLLNGGGSNIIGTVKTANATAGAIKFICELAPLSENGSVRPSVNARE